MTALTFPSNPQSGDSYSAPNGVLYTYDGVKWIAQTTTTTGTMVVDYVQDSVVPIFTNIVSDNISFSYNSETNVLSATVTAQADTGTITFSGNTLESASAAGFLNLYNGSEVAIGSNDNIPLIISVNQNGGASNWMFNTDSSITFPDSSVQTTAYPGFDQPLNTTDSVTFNEITSTALWQTNAKTVSPARTLVPGATPTVVFTAPNWFTSFKLVIAVEGRLDGDGTNVDHTQTCEATIAATYNTTAEPIMSVYGVVYTSPTPLATFTVARNGGNIEVTAVNSQTTNNLDVRVQAIQFVSRYD